MSVLYAICPHCHKTIVVKDDASAENKCSFCEAILSYSFLKEKEAFIDLEGSNADFADAKLYFDNTDFRGAGEYFEKSLKNNPNNYLSQYFHGLCDIYENGDHEDYNVPKSLVMTIKVSLEKMINSQIELKHRISFLCAALNEVYIILLSSYNKLCEAYDNKENRPFFRRKVIVMLAAINELHAIDKELLLVFDPAIASSLVGITDLCISACVKVLAPHLLDPFTLDVATDAENNQVRTFYNTFVTYAISLEPKYTPENHTVDFSENLQANKECLLLIDKYYTLNKDNNKKHLSLTGEFLDNMNRQCMTALKLTYHTCVNNVGIAKSDNIRIALMNQAIMIGYERLRPRLYIDSNKRVCVLMGILKETRAISEYIEFLFESLPENQRRNALESLDAFYGEIFEMSDLYYSLVNKSYAKIINKLKKQKNDEFRYYRTFLFNMTLCCTPALCDILAYPGKKLKSRINLLKLCKLISEEFLLMCDYRIDAIEASEKFSDILKIYSALDNDIMYLSKL